MWQKNGDFERVNMWGKRNKRNVDEDGMMDSEVYFDFAFSCDTDPERLLNRIKIEWRRQGGVRL